MHRINSKRSSDDSIDRFVTERSKIINDKTPVSFKWCWIRQTFNQTHQQNQIRIFIEWISSTMKTQKVLSPIQIIFFIAQRHSYFAHFISMNNSDPLRRSFFHEKYVSNWTNSSFMITSNKYQTNRDMYDVDRVFYYLVSSFALI